MIQKLFRKFQARKKLKFLYKSELFILSKKSHILINEILPEKFINIKFSETIREIFHFFNLNFKKKSLDIENLLNKFDNFSGDLISKKLKNSLKLNLNPIMRFVSSSFYEYYWGEWNMSYKKHGFGLKITSGKTFYLGSFIEDELEGFGILIFNIIDDSQWNDKENILNSNDNSSRSHISYESNLRRKNLESNFNTNRSSIDFSGRSNNERENNINRNTIYINDNISNNSQISENSKEKEDDYMKCTLYIGEFKNGFSEGKGELFLPNGEYFKGEFLKNKCHGKGEYHFKNNEIHKGYFYNNQIEKRENDEESN